MVCGVLEFLPSRLAGGEVVCGGCHGLAVLKPAFPHDHDILVAGESLDYFDQDAVVDAGLDRNEPGTVLLDDVHGFLLSVVG